MTDKEKDTQEVEDKETVDSQDDFEIEVVDDTPAEDKGKVPLKAGDSPEPTEDELENYSEKVQNRIGKLNVLIMMREGLKKLKIEKQLKRITMLKLYRKRIEN